MPVCLFPVGNQIANQKYPNSHPAILQGKTAAGKGKGNGQKTTRHEIRGGGGRSGPCPRSLALPNSVIAGMARSYAAKGDVLPAKALPMRHDEETHPPTPLCLTPPCYFLLLTFHSSLLTPPSSPAAGKLIKKVDPCPSWLFTATSPPWVWAMCLTMESPSPVPPSLRLRALSLR